MITKAHNYDILSAGSLSSCAVVERRHQCDGLDPVNHARTSGNVTGPGCPILQNHNQPALVPASATGKLKDKYLLKNHPINIFLQINHQTAMKALAFCVEVLY